MLSEFQKEMLQELAIDSKPAYSYDECMQLFKGQSKGEEAFNEFDDAKKLFRELVYLCGEDELAFLQMVVELSEKKEPWQDDVKYYPFRAFAFNNFAFLFNYEDCFHLVMPSEFIEIYRLVIGGENFNESSNLNQEYHTYAEALCNLYGAYEIKQFANVWNKHHKDKITTQEAEEFLSTKQCLNCDYYLGEGFVIHDCLFDDDFDELLESTHGQEYYMPSKSVIKEYAKKGYTEPDSKEYIEMNEFLLQFVENESVMENLLLDIMISCERLWGPNEIVDTLKTAELPIKDANFCSKFERLYNNLRDTVHIWELRGHLPHQYKTATGNSIVHFSFAKT